MNDTYLKVIAFAGAFAFVYTYLFMLGGAL